MENVMSWIHIMGITLLLAGTGIGVWVVEHRMKSEKRNP